ncbi:MAG: MBL fold metallo-hydrolase [Alloprevotella sp.]|nr:MBL fold metallo-hydrolase [Alloprevotella sp.]
MFIQRFICNFIEENCYVLWDDTREAVLVDCGAQTAQEQTAVIEFIKDNKLTPVSHLLTHGHFDHIFGAQALYDVFGLSPRVHTADVSTYYGAAEQMSLFLHRRIDIELPQLGPTISGDEEIRFGTHTLRVIHTPGHTPGGVCYYLADEHLLLSGDSLFRGSIGRCDLPGSDHHALVTALRERVLTLPEETVVLPGHGPQTTIAAERHNPYLL